MIERSRQILLLASVLLLAVAVGAATFAWRRGTDVARERVFVVPPGAVTRLAAGEPLDVLPATITMTLGQQDVLVIRNDDTQPITVGPFRIAPGQQFRQQYYNPGTFDLQCTLHTTTRLRIVVQ